MTVDERRIAVLGAGKIGEALVSGLLSSGWREPGEIVATGRRPERLDELRERYRIRTTLSNAEAAAGAALVVIAVKPQDIEGLLGEIGGISRPEQTVLSIAAAIPTAAIERHLAAGVPVVRAMPNTPSTVHEGIAGSAPARTPATRTSSSRRRRSRTSARSSASPSATWTPSPPSPAPALPTSRCSPRR